jgi:hypothetical protein
LVDQQPSASLALAMVVAQPVAWALVAQRPWQSVLAAQQPLPFWVALWV